MVVSYHALYAFSATSAHGKGHIIGGGLTDGGDDDVELVERTHAWKQGPARRGGVDRARGGWGGTYCIERGS